MDVNDDGHVTQADLLAIVQDVNSKGVRKLSAGLDDGNAPGLFVDVNEDGFVTPIDILHIINHLNEAQAEYRLHAQITKEIEFS